MSASKPNPSDRTPSTPGTPSTPSTPRTRREHRAVRASAERRRSAAQKDFNRLQRLVRKDLRGVRREGGTAVIVTRSRLAEFGVQGISRLLKNLRPGRETH